MRRYIKSSYGYSCDWGALTDAMWDDAVREKDVKQTLKKALDSNHIKYSSLYVGDFAWTVDGLSFEDYDSLVDIGQYITDEVETEFGVNYGEYEYTIDWTDAVTDALMDNVISEYMVARALRKFFNKESIGCDSISIGEFAWSVTGLSLEDYEKLQAFEYEICEYVERELGI